MVGWPWVSANGGVGSLLMVGWVPANGGVGAW